MGLPRILADAQVLPIWEGTCAAARRFAINGVDQVTDVTTADSRLLA